MTLNGVMAIILRYFADYVKWLISHQQIFSEKCHKVHQLARRTLCGLRGSGTSCCASYDFYRAAWNADAV